MKLITEQINDVQYLTETTKDGKKEQYIQGIFMQSEVKNRNGRWYPRPLLEREAHRYNENYISKNRAFGELGHPDSPTINLDRVSHMITSLQAEGNNFVGKAKILDTPNGKIVKSLLEGGASLGVSTRGVGSLKPHGGYQLVQDDFHLATAADVVADPSAPESFVQGVMENYDYWQDLNTGEWHRKLEVIREDLKAMNRREIEEKKLQIFEKFMRGL